MEYRGREGAPGEVAGALESEVWEAKGRKGFKGGTLSSVGCCCKVERNEHLEFTRNLGAVEVITDFDRNSFSGMVGLRELD